MAVCGPGVVSPASPYIKESTESRKTLEQKNIYIFFKSGLLILMVSTNSFHSTNLFCCFSRYQVPINKQLLDEVFVISRIIEVEVGVISRSRRLRLITLTKTSIILNITKTESNNCFIIHWTEKIEVIFFASSLTPSSTKRANLTWLLLEIMHRGHTWPWHDYPWPWHDYCIICKFWRHGRWFRKFTVGFRPIKKELESWMYNNRA